MKKISRITTQQKRKDRYNIYLTDGQKEDYAFSVDEAILIEFQLRKGLELDKETIEELLEQDNLQKSYLLAINYLSYRMRTVKEMKDYLMKKEIEPNHISVIMERLLNRKLLDDRLFSEMFVQTRINTSIKGPQLIKKELMEKGVSESIAANAITLYPYEIQIEKVHKWVEKKLKPSKKEAFKNQLQKLQVTLMQKGFTQPVIQDALAEVDDKKDETAEWEAVVYQGDKLNRRYQAKHEGYMLQNKIKEGLYRKGFSMDLINRYLEEYVNTGL
ncbi:recombination regulator RecX [Oceanobacillus piezotolerans]|uniref:Regulatory protein RecX n=1 Tax=Oceanobacillus piezotolerans TaxID=2448030 RepID=A0A498D169_9BACI|nr:recombination regulator RecX [Oceanobacillus piezotolerans]RLL40344.1 recombination regulator RecX [Oceanobacillus piezotolerans]